MKRLIVTGAALMVLAVPAGATAQTSSTDKSNAAKECRAERGSTAATREASRFRYGNGRNAFGKCVSARARAEAKQRIAAPKNAAKECAAERSQLGEAAFAAKYGSGKKGKNAFGKCVSGKSKANKDAGDRADARAIAKRKSAAKTCAAEREQDRAGFAAKYGTNRNKRNAFGKCVSAVAKKA